MTLYAPWEADDMSDATWEQKINRFYEDQFDEADARGSITKMRDLIAERPLGDAEALFELGGVHDSLGLEEEAIPLYRQAIEAGLEGESAIRVCIQLASTLRTSATLQKLSQSSNPCPMPAPTKAHAKPSLRWRCTMKVVTGTP